MIKASLPPAALPPNISAFGDFGIVFGEADPPQCTSANGSMIQGQSFACGFAAEYLLFGDCEAIAFGKVDPPASPYSYDLLLNVASPND